MAHYLVTGGAGFIGSNIVERLLQRGERVTILDNFSTGRSENIEFSDSYNLIKGDIRDIEVCSRACKGVDYVLHQAALGSVPRSIEDPKTTHEVNITGTLNMLIAANENNVKRFVFASSSSIYGDQMHSGRQKKTGKTMAKIETMTPMPQSPYAASKIAGEYYCRVFYTAYGLETIALRYFNVFGIRQDPHSQYAAVVPLFFKAVLHDKSPHIFGDGEQSRDFTFIENVVDANILACHADSRAPGRVFNIACGNQLSINELFKLILKVTGKKVKPVYDPPRAGDIKHSLADISMAQEFLGYRVLIPFEQGLQKTATWYKNMQ